MRTKEWTYKTTHPWITFELDTKAFTPELWVLLGECQSKCEHVAGVPLRPSTANELNQVYLTRGIRATTAIEGNTLTEEEVRNRINAGSEPPYSSDDRVKEIDNILMALDKTLRTLREGHRPALSIDRIMDYNRTVLQGLPVASHVFPGQIRNHAIAVGMYRGVPHEECEYCLRRLCDWLETLTVVKTQPAVNSIVKAILAHIYVAWIHPFSDGNGRTARLVEVELLLRAGVPEPSAHLLSNHFNATRNVYYDQLEQASVSGGNVIPFLTYALVGLVGGLKMQLWRIRDEQWHSIWINYVHDVFKGKDSIPDKRRRDMVIDLSTEILGIPRELITRMFPRAAAAYANLTQKTLTRDVSLLLEQGLIREDENGALRPNREKILAFLPMRVEN